MHSRVVSHLNGKNAMTIRDIIKKCALRKLAWAIDLIGGLPCEIRFEPLFDEHLSIMRFEIFLTMCGIRTTQTGFVINQFEGPTILCRFHKSFVVLLKS